MKNVYIGLINNGYYLNLKGVRNAINDTIRCNTLNDVLDILSGKGNHIQKDRKLYLIYDKEVKTKDIEYIKEKAPIRRIKLEELTLDKRYR